MCTETEGLGRLLVTHSSENPIEPIAYIARSLIKFERCRRSNKEQYTRFIDLCAEIDSFWADFL